MTQFFFGVTAQQRLQPATEAFEESTTVRKAGIMAVTAAAAASLATLLALFRKKARQ